jgi:dTDP-4-dehydrorhamnose 3,5-epimerase
MRVVRNSHSEDILNMIRLNQHESIIPEGIVAFESEKHLDQRGFFQVDLNSLILDELGFKKFFQKNISKSAIGVIRGMHWQSGDAAQKKIIACLQGSVIDIVVDLRETSSTYGSISAFKLNAENPHYIKLPAGFAHGFQSLEENTIFSYYVDAPYAPEKEKCINPLSDEFEIYWENLPRIVNQKDQSSINFKKYLSETLKEEKL